ncbi:hypothetical protein HOO68_04745 [Candidatus Gracilibacteria bacterium]|nr:hypothetical protein [Candidatus Gracilibacteria bacterium]
MYSTIITPTFKLDANYITKLLGLISKIPHGTYVELDDDDLTEEEQHDYIQALFLQVLFQSGILCATENSPGDCSINTNLPNLTF